MHEGKSHSSTMSCVVWNCLFIVKRHEKYIRGKGNFAFYTHSHTLIQKKTCSILNVLS